LDLRHLTTPRAAEANMRELDLDSEGSVFAQLITQGINHFNSKNPRPLRLPVTRIDIQFDLLSADVPVVWSFLDMTSCRELYDPSSAPGVNADR